MGKKRTVNKSAGSADAALQSRSLSRMPKKKLESGILNVLATYNNTQVTLTDINGNVVTTSSSGALGFKGARKSTPYAAAKVGELLGEKAHLIGMQAVDVIIRGVGAGRESAMRAFANKGVAINRVVDKTPIAFNGPRPRKPRRV